MEMLGERPAWSMSDSEKLSALDAVFAECARLETIGLHLIAGLEQSGHAKDLGAADTAELLSLRYRIDTTKARRDVRVATALTQHPTLAAALPDPATPFPDPATADASGTDAGDPAAPDADGEPDGGLTGAVGWRVHPAQAEAIVSILAKVPATVPVENIAVAEQHLIGLAATHTPAQLRQAGKQIRAILDPDGPAPDETKAYAREALTLKPAEQGVTFRGYLANENAELFRTLIHAGAKPHKTRDGGLDPRPRAKRQADALANLLNTAATTHHMAGPTRATGTTGSPGTADAAAAGSGAAPAASPTGPPGNPDQPGGPGQNDGADAGNASGSNGSNSSGSGDGEVGGDGSLAGGFVPGYGPKAHINVTIDFNDLKAATATGALVFGDNLSAATIRRLACDADILPIVLGSKSQPLDVGTSQRLATRAIRRALNTRDKGCVICGAPPIQCEAHHLTHWIDGGATAVSNMVLLCKRHHIDLHAGHWHIHITNGIVHVTRPTWANPTPIPHGRYRPPTTPINHPRTTSNTAPPGPSPHARPLRTDATQPNPWADTPEPAQQTTGPDPSAEAVTFNPWGDDSEPAPRSADVRSPVTTATRLDPWGDVSTTEPGPSAGKPARISTASLADFDPWGDDSSAATAGIVGSSRSMEAELPVTAEADSAEFDPWGEVVTDAVIGSG